MCWANNSFPVPVAPTRKIGSVVGANRSISMVACLMAGEMPTIGANAIELTAGRPFAAAAGSRYQRLRLSSGFGALRTDTIPYDSNCDPHGQTILRLAECQTVSARHPGSHSSADFCDP